MPCGTSSATCRCFVSCTLNMHNDKVDKLTFTVVCNVQFIVSSFFAAYPNMHEFCLSSGLSHYSAIPYVFQVRWLSYHVQMDRAVLHHCVQTQSCSTCATYLFLVCSHDGLYQCSHVEEQTQLYCYYLRVLKAIVAASLFYVGSSKHPMSLLLGTLHVLHPFFM